MRKIIPTIMSPLWSLFFLMLGSGFFFSYISMDMKNNGYSEMAIGVVHSCYYIGLFIGSIGAEKLLRRVGYIRAFATFASIHSATMLAMGIALNPIAWALFRLVAGFCMAAMYVVIESWLLAASSVNTRGRILSLYMIFLYFGQSISQYALDIIDLSAHAPFIVAGLINTIAIVPIAITRFESPEILQHKTDNILKYFWISPFGTLGCLVSGIILASIYSFSPNFAQERGLSVSVLVSITIIGGALLQMPIGRYSDLFDRRIVMVIVSFALTIPSILIVTYSDWDFFTFVFAFFMGGLTFTLYPLSISQVCDRVHPNDITSVTGVLCLLYALGAFIGPLVIPLFMKAFGIGALYGCIASLGLILGIVGLIAIYARKPILPEEKVTYVPLPPSTPTVYDLDPRAPDDRYNDGK